MNDTTWFWEIVDAHGLADVSSDETVALNELISKAERATTAEAERDELLREKERLGAALRKVKHWAESRCPCHNEQPNPCPLCGASVENLEACKSAENTLPRDVLEAVRNASARSALAPLGEE